MKLIKITSGCFEVDQIDQETFTARFTGKFLGDMSDFDTFVEDIHRLMEKYKI